MLTQISLMDAAVFSRLFFPLLNIANNPSSPLLSVSISPHTSIHPVVFTASWAHHQLRYCISARHVNMLPFNFAAAALAGFVTIGLAHQCQQFELSIPLDVPQNKYWLEHPKSNIDVTNFMLDLTRRGHDYASEITRPSSAV